MTATSHTRIETASTALLAARAALDEGRERLRGFVATEAKLKAEDHRLTDASQAQAIAGERPEHVAAIERLAGELRFIAKARERFAAYELRDLMETEATADLELARALYAGEELRLRQHESQLAAQIRVLQQITGNSHFSVGGGASEAEAKRNSDFIGDRLEALVRLALQTVRAKESALADVRQTSINMKREYIRKYGAA